MREIDWQPVAASTNFMTSAGEGITLASYGLPVQMKQPALALPALVKDSEEMKKKNSRYRSL